MYRILDFAIPLLLVAAYFHAVSATETDRIQGGRTEVEKLAAQVKELQKQIAEQSPRIVAAGTATWKLGKAQNHTTSVRVQLKDEVASRLGDDYLVILTSRHTGYPFYSAYWKKAKDGFDIILVDPTVAPGGSVSYIFNVNNDFPVDWIVVKK
jgi:hypothetical protein